MIEMRKAHKFLFGESEAKDNFEDLCECERIINLNVNLRKIRIAGAILTWTEFLPIERGKHFIKGHPLIYQHSKF
jgi:hypothetical protein